jgi:hypothetical protein
MIFTRYSRWPLWIVGVVGVLAYAIVFYPGAMSFDSAYQWWQARGGETTNIHGVGMTWFWRAGNALAPGPGVIFVLQLLLLWGGLAFIAQHLSAPTLGRVAFMLVAASAPVCFVLFSHVWSDVMLMVVLTCAVGTMLHARGRHRLWLLPGWALLCLAITLRHNAVAAVFPMLIYMEHLRNVQVGRAAAKSLRTVGIALLVTVLFQFGAYLLERTVDQRRTLFAVTAEWDLAAISLDVGVILLPPDSHGPGLTLDDLRHAFVPYTAATIFERTQAGMRQPFFAPADPLNDEIRRAWIEAIVTHPRAYLAHRWRLTKALFGSKSGDWPRGLVYVDGVYQYDGNPPVAPNTSSAHAWCSRLFDAMYESVLLSAWPYLCLTLVALALAWRRRHQADMGPAFAVLTSGLLYAAPLPFVAPSAELRYTGWTCLAALIGTALVLAAPRKTSTGAAGLDLVGSSDRGSRD